MTDRLSIRERDLLLAISRCDAVGLSSLAIVYEKTIPEDELLRVLGSLQQRDLVCITPGMRTSVVTLTTSGRKTVWELGRG